jgi:aminopeptidase YwaD
MTTGLETQLMDHLNHLCVEIGPRPLGSRENQSAADYIERVFETSGLEVEAQKFPCPLWKEISTQLEASGERLAAMANTFSPPCDVTAPAVALGTVAELEAVELTGRIGVLYGELTKNHGIGARSAAYFPEHAQKIVRLLEEKQPVALVTVHQRPGCLERLLRDWEFSIPSATVPTEVGLALLHHSDRPLHLRIESQRTAGHFCNVVARRAGRRPERVTLLAHFDTQADTPGATDNGSGVAVLLALGEVLAQRDLEVGLEWIAMNGEECGGVGGAEYLRRRAGELGQMLAVINVDGVGQRLAPTSVTVMGDSEALEERVRQVHERYPTVVWSTPWYESDHSAFLWRGVPCVPFTSAGAVDVIHLPSDTVEWISPARLAEVVTFIADVVASLQEV